MMSTNAVEVLPQRNASIGSLLEERKEELSVTLVDALAAGGLLIPYSPEVERTAAELGLPIAPRRRIAERETIYFHKYGTGSAGSPVTVSVAANATDWDPVDMTVISTGHSNAAEGVWNFTASNQLLQLEPFIQPNIIPNVDDSARRLLTRATTRVLNDFIGITSRTAELFHVPVVRIDVTGYTDPEEGNSELVITYWVGLRSREAFRFWDKIGAAIGEWTKTISAKEVAIALDRMSVDVQWLR